MDSTIVMGSNAICLFTTIIGTWHVVEVCRHTLEPRVLFRDKWIWAYMYIYMNA